MPKLQQFRRHAQLRKRRRKFAAAAVTIMATYFQNVLLIAGSAAGLLLPAPRIPRTRVTSLFHSLYSVMPSVEFRQHFRLPKDLFYYIHQELTMARPGYPDGVLSTRFVWRCIVFEFACAHCGSSRRVATSQRSIPTLDKLALYLMRLADGHTYRTLALKFDMARSYCTHVAAQVSAAIQVVFASEIRWPTREESVHNMHVFESRVGMQHCVGAADSTEIPLRAEAELKFALFNHKQFHSFKAHAVVNSE
jgi:hypothetical protein